MSLGLYFHIPFCERKCCYCDFYSTAYNEKLKEEYVNAILKEVEEKACNVIVDSIYFGGGTPSLLGVKDFEKILATIYRFFNISSFAEISIEVNPDTISYEKLKSLKECGINRISFGVQSFNDYELKRLGRTHNAYIARKYILLAKKAGFNNISIDLMIGISGQTKESLIKTLNIATKLPLTHISIYQLKIEKNTVFYIKRPTDLPSDDFVAEFYETCVNLLKEANFLQYEISNFAKKGFSCKHNLKYWTLKEYLGFGAAAHSFYKNKRFFHKSSIKEYIKNPFKTEKEEVELDYEWFILKLRLNEGINITDLKLKKFYVPYFVERAKLLKEKGLIEIKDGILKLSLKGMLLQNSIIIYFLPSK